MTFMYSAGINCELKDNYITKRQIPIFLNSRCKYLRIMLITGLN